jgi:nicotinamide phosphoribosyltransferase
MLSNYQKNLCVNTDSYKVGMNQMYPPGTETVFSYIESRGGLYDSTVFFGLQAFIKEYLLTPVTQADVDFAAKFWALHGEPFNKEGWEYIVNQLGGKLPVVIRAVPEGTVVPIKNVLVTIENTDPKCFWLTTWIETALLRAIWYPTTVATQSRSIKQVIKGYLEKTGDVSGLNFKLHDFGARGVSSFESAALGGMAHLINFMGSDTATGVLAASEYYNEPMAGFSIPASEHSVITSWGRENEAKAYANMIAKFAKPGALVACVSDSYDILAACDMWGALKDEIIASGAIIVIRPDSGDPATVVSEVVRRLDQHFGHTVNSKGYKVLNNVRVIQGDGINESSIRGILLQLEFGRYSADNVAFGMGGQLLQILNRDTQQFAMKCSAIKVNGEWRDVYKDPVGDSGKKSKKGRITLVNHYGKFETVRINQGEVLEYDVMQEVYRDGTLVKECTFAEVRANAE